MGNTLEQLNLSSAFLFAAALSDPDTCRIVLEILLGQKISKVNVKSENMLLYNPETRCVRLDVHATDEMNVDYDLEAQNVNENNLPKRCRFYQSEMDMTSLKPGQDFNDLKQAYVIFICTFDPFDEGLCRYTFERTCKENGRSLGDESQIILFNTKGKNMDEISDELQHFFEYFEESTDEYVSTITDESIIELHERIVRLKKSRELEAGYMKFEEYVRSHERRACIELLKKNIVEVLVIKGISSDEIKQKIEAELNPDTLNRWFTASVKAETQEEFIKNM